MPTGVIINAILILAGSFTGYAIRRHIPARIINALTSVFGISSMVIGISLITKFQSLPAVILALIIGTIIGELLDLEHRLAAFSQKAKTFAEKRFAKSTAEDDDEYIEKFINLLLLMCTGSTGILGALVEGMTGDRTVLFAKSVLDFFTAIIFAASMGPFVAVIAFFQFFILSSLFFLAGTILPLTTPALIADFTGCGGVIALMTGIRMLEMRSFHVTNVLPALFIIMPISCFWSRLFS